MRTPACVATCLPRRQVIRVAKGAAAAAPTPVRPQACLSYICWRAPPQRPPGRAFVIRDCPADLCSPRATGPLPMRRSRRRRRQTMRATVHSINFPVHASATLACTHARTPHQHRPARAHACACARARTHARASPCALQLVHLAMEGLRAAGCGEHGSPMGRTPTPPTLRTLPTTRDSIGTSAQDLATPPQRARAAAPEACVGSPHSLQRVAGAYCST